MSDQRTMGWRLYWAISAVLVGAAGCAHGNGSAPGSAGAASRSEETVSTGATMSIDDLDGAPADSPTAIDAAAAPESTEAGEASEEGGLEDESFEGESDDSASALIALHEDVMLADDRLASQLEAGAACDDLDETVSHICALAERICTLADRHAERPGLAERCDDAGERCALARRRVDAACP